MWHAWPLRKANDPPEMNAGSPCRAALTVASTLPVQGQYAQPKRVHRERECEITLRVTIYLSLRQRTKQPRLKDPQRGLPALRVPSTGSSARAAGRPLACQSWTQLPRRTTTPTRPWTQTRPVNAQRKESRQPGSGPGLAGQAPARPRSPCSQEAAVGRGGHGLRASRLMR